MKLGKREIDALTCPANRRDTLVFDEEVTGFCIRVTAKTKVFLFQYRRGSAVRRLTLGRYGDITPAQARNLALRARGQVAAGGDPAGERRLMLEAEAETAKQKRKKADIDGYTVQNLIDDWARTGLASRSAAHKKEAPAALKRNLGPRLLGAPASSLTHAELQRIVDAIAARHPVAARRLRDYGRAMMNWGMQRQKIASNPFASVVIEAPVADRDRVLTDEELGATWRAAGAMPYPFGPLIQLMILTLQRRNEVAGLQWSELSSDGTLWTIPSRRAKNRKGHLVHLTEQVRQILADIPHVAGCDLVFTLTGKTPVSGFSRAMEELRDAVAGEKTPRRENGRKSNLAGIAEPWRLHDFRRTGVTAMARLGVAMQVADRILNHVESKGSRSVAEIYQRHEFLAERRAAAELWAAHVLAVAAEGPQRTEQPVRKQQRFRRRPTRKPKPAP